VYGSREHFSPIPCSAPPLLGKEIIVFDLFVRLSPQFVGVALDEWAVALECYRLYLLWLVEVLPPSSVSRPKGKGLVRCGQMNAALQLLVSVCEITVREHKPSPNALLP
jgi:hypothetical protein